MGEVGRVFTGKALNLSNERPLLVTSLVWIGYPKAIDQARQQKAFHHSTRDCNRYWSHNANRKCTFYTAEAVVLKLSGLKILVYKLRISKSYAYVGYIYHYLPY